LLYKRECEFDGERGFAIAEHLAPQEVKALQFFVKRDIYRYDIAGQNYFFEAGVFDAAKDGHTPPGGKLATEKNSRRLKDAFAQENAGRDGRAGIMTFIEIFVLAKFPAADDAVFALRNHFIDKEKRRAVRDGFKNGLHVFYSKFRE
jgi:hypothetical protein